MACDPQKLESNPEKGSRGRQCVLVMESSEDRIGAHDVAFSAAMARSRSGNRECRGIGNPRTQPHMGPSAIVMLDPRTKGCPQLSFRQGNEPVQTLPAKGPDHPLAATYIFGLCGADFQTRIPSARIDSSSWPEKMPWRS